MATRTVKRVWEVCEPHPDVFLRDPDPSLFAISLHHVAHGSADQGLHGRGAVFQPYLYDAGVVGACWSG
jgi:hypothetical protein